MRELLAPGGRHYHEVQVRAPGAAVEDRQLDTELVAKVGCDVRHHIGLGGRSQAQHGRDRVHSRLLADEPPHVTVVGPEIVSPLRQAVGLVQHPSADLALVEHPAQRTVAELFRRDDENAGVPEPHPVQGVGPLGQGQQPVDGDAGDDAACLQTRHLIRHEGDQGRDHHREGAGLVVAGQGRDLVAERFAGAGGQDPQDMLPRHRRLDDGALHGLSRVIVQRLRPEVLEAEPAGELLAGIVPFPAPAAAGVGAGGVAQGANDVPRLRELVADPRRHHRVAPRHRQPCEGIGQRPAVASGIGQDLAAVGPTGDSRQQPADRLAPLRVGRPQRPPQAGEEGVEAGLFFFPGGEPVPGGDQVRRSPGSALQSTPLVAEDIQREPGIELRVVQPASLELSVLVVLDQVVIGIAWKGKRIEPQRIHRRQAQEPKIGLRRREMREIEGDQVVPDQKGGSLGQRIKLLQRRRQIPASKDQAASGIGPQCGKGADAAVADADFEVQRQAAGRHTARRRPGCLHALSDHVRTGSRRRPPPVACSHSLLLSPLLLSCDTGPSHPAA